MQKGVRKGVEECTERGKEKEGGMKLKNKCIGKQKMKIKKGEK